MISLKRFALDGLIIACLLVAVAVGASIPGSRLIGAFLDRFSPPPPPSLAPARETLLGKKDLPFAFQWLLFDLGYGGRDSLEFSGGYGL